MTALGYYKFGHEYVPTPATIYTGFATAALVGALGSAEEDLRRHGTCALAAMGELATCTMAMGDG